MTGNSAISDQAKTLGNLRVIVTDTLTEPHSWLPMKDSYIRRVSEECGKVEQDLRFRHANPEAQTNRGSVGRITGRWIME